MSLDCDFLVMGGGVAGLSAALGVARLGAKVTVIERGSCGAESSWAGGGILSPLCPWDYSDEVTRLTCRGAELFPAWAGELREATGIDPEYRVSGMVVLPPFDKTKASRWCERHGVSLVEREDALFLPEVAQVRNPRLMQSLRKRLELMGGRIVEQCAVQEIICGGERVQKLATSCGEFVADRFIVAAGAWSREVLGQYAMKMDIKPVRGQMLLFKFEAPPLSHILLQDGLYLIPRRDGHVLAGSTLEDVGFDKRTTQTAYDEILRRAQAMLPQLHNMPVVRQWAGLRPASPHNIPAIGRHPLLQNLYINSGHFRYGVTMAPASVEILLNEIGGGPQPYDVSPYQAGWKGAGGGKIAEHC